MRWLFVSVFLFWISSICSAWDKFDHEIFDLVGELEADGQSSFYGWLDVPSTAPTADIARAYRKLSMQLHPDKNPGVNGAQERFSRLGKVSTILRNTENRDYDFFYKNGVPKWRGTGYYYSRFRPGLGTVAVFLILMTSGVHYLIQKINYKRDIERIDRFISDAQLAAWGPKLIPLDAKRKVKVNMAGRAQYDTRSKLIDMVVSKDEVHILDPSGELHLLDRSAATVPSMANTWFFALIKSNVGKLPIVGHSHGETIHSSDDDTDGVSDATSDSGAFKEAGSKGKKRKNLKRP